jgi:hypothetical protein
MTSLTTCADNCSRFIGGLGVNRKADDSRRLLESAAIGFLRVAWREL